MNYKRAFFVLLTFVAITLTFFVGYSTAQFLNLNEAEWVKIPLEGGLLNLDFETYSVSAVELGGTSCFVFTTTGYAEEDFEVSCVR
jgi:hypothetical protein